MVMCRLEVAQSKLTQEVCWHRPAQLRTGDVQTTECRRIHLQKMPKHNLFPPLSILAYMTRVVIRYKPGKRKTEVCRQLVKTLEEKATKKKFPSLSYACDILNSEDEPATIEFHLTTGKRHRFFAEKYSLSEMQMTMDRDQFAAHLGFMKQKSLEKPNADEE
eukprot:GHVQ01023241.1.p1 GENE.GHVQ01023241.1~~GHVQ01023241.1.p1  ORF type:complete len:162 (-),score=12.90 GHVQ01023241.1:1240-1725(-)